MNNHIQIYKNVIEPEYCDELIQKFERETWQQEKVDHAAADMTQIDFNESNWHDDVNKLTDISLEYIMKYKKDCDLHDFQWPNEYAFEHFRMKRYLPNDKDEFKPHVDNTSLPTMSRFLVFFIYLNDNEKGETYFPKLDISSPCKKGSILIFPPLWPWLHGGAKPINKSKYIVGSYLHTKDKGVTH
jgi:prolyl 4-hydroxylase